MDPKAEPGGKVVTSPLGQPGNAPKRLYGSLDAAKVRIEPRCPEEKAQRKKTCGI